MRRVEDSILAPAIQDTQVIPNGVDVEIFQPPDNKDALRQRIGVDPADFVIAFAANKVRHSRFKDYPTFRSAVAKVSACSGRSVVILGIGGEGRSEMFGEARSIFVPFNPSAAKMVQYLQAADIFVHAAKADTFPNSVIEALACGIPVIATAVGGIPEQVDSDTTGFLVPAGDAEQIAGRISLLLHDEDLRRGMGDAAQRTARRRFNLASQAAAYLDWYQTILETSRKSPVERK
jgi:glycosyltransferase involved in cell wall biosynthesis